MDQNLSKLGSFGLVFDNFDANKIQTEETINCVFVVDVSPSVRDYEDELNNGFNEFVQRMQKSHVADRLFVSTLEFNENINVKTGFQPIVNVSQTNFKASGRGTALYDATKAGLKNALDYRKQLEDSGIVAKTLLFVITDGEDNASRSYPSEVKQIIDDFMKEEKNAYSFQSILFGVNLNLKDKFERAKQEMGIQNMAATGTSADEIRKMINIISTSVSTTSNGQPLNVTF